MFHMNMNDTYIKSLTVHFYANISRNMFDLSELCDFRILVFLIDGMIEEDNQVRFFY